MKILKTVQKVPGGLMVIPLLLGVIMNTVAPGVLQLGGLTTAIFSSAGANAIIGCFLVCVGASIGWLVGATFGMAGVFGISSLAIISAVTNSNGGLFMALVGECGDEKDVASQAIMNINDGPFLTLVALGASGMGDIPFVTMLAAIGPILVGLILGNLDKDIADFLKPGLNVMIPFFAFCLGAGIGLSSLIAGGIPGIALGVFTVLWSGSICCLADKFILKRPGYAGWACSTAAGNCVATPAAMIAGGCQVIAFTTGRGTPTGNALAPVLKITANRTTFQHMIDNMDIDLSAVVEGESSIEDAGAGMFDELIEICNGKMTKAEIFGFSDIAIDRICRFI